MLIVANLLLVVTGFLFVLLTLSSKRTGPEGPVGFHMVTAPLALGQAIGLALAIGSGALSPLGPVAPQYLALPGLAVGLTVLPFGAFDRRHRLPVRFAAVAAVAGPLLAANASGAVQIAGGVLALLPALFGYGLLLVLFVRAQKRQIARAQAEVSRQSEFESSQAAWQRGEWAKLPANAELWQLIQFTHSFDPEVKAQCHQRIAALPDLPAAMQELLGTGWAEHALSYLRDFYPQSRAPLAPALSAFLVKEADRWRSSLQGTNPGSWYANLLTYVQVAELCAKDGGDVREGMRAWAAMLQGQRGLESLRTTAQQLAAAAPVG